VDRAFLDANVLFSAPPDDQVIFLAAMAARATHLLTGDRTHLGRYDGRTIAGVLILPPNADLRG
jgi:hypothetical protein